LQYFTDVVCVRELLNRFVVGDNANLLEVHAASKMSAIVVQGKGKVAPVLS
jgi:hypothetical protein